MKNREMSANFTVTANTAENFHYPQILIVLA